VREFSFQPSRLGLIQTFGFLGFILAFDWLVFEHSDFNWPIKFISALGAGLVGLFLFRMVGLSSLRALKQ
jgi:hypothetical protein